MDRLIRSIPNWESLTPEVILQELRLEKIPFLDTSDWTWKGIAAVMIPEKAARFGDEGNRLLQKALSERESFWLISQLASGIPLVDSEIQQTLYAYDYSGLVPGARHIARAVKRDISLLEQHQIFLDDAQILAAIEDLQLRNKRDICYYQGVDRLQAFRESLDRWDGKESTRPNL